MHVGIKEQHDNLSDLGMAIYKSSMDGCITVSQSGYIADMLE
jgi:hypothetical protein